MSFLGKANVSSFVVEAIAGLGAVAAEEFGGGQGAFAGRLELEDFQCPIARGDEEESTVYPASDLFDIFFPRSHALDVFKRGLIDPSVSLPRIIAMSHIKLLQEADHVGATKPLFERLQTFAAYFIQGSLHRLAP